jgi:hypothetical protein
MTEIQYDIREIPDPEGGLVLELWVEGARVSTARASGDVLAQMAADFGTARDGMRAFLGETLARNFKQQLGKVELSPPKAIPAGGLRFVSRYVYRDLDTIYTRRARTGTLVWPASCVLTPCWVPFGPDGAALDLIRRRRRRHKWKGHRHYSEVASMAFYEGARALKIEARALRIG